MRHPDWYALVLAALAVWRSYRLGAVDEITERPRGAITLRDWVYDSWSDEIEKRRAGGFDPWDHVSPPPFSRARYKWARFARCPWCLGFWLSVLWWIAWLAWPAAMIALSVPMALSALVGITQQLMED